MLNVANNIAQGSSCKIDLVLIEGKLYVKKKITVPKEYRNENSSLLGRLRSSE